MALNSVFGRNHAWILLFLKNDKSGMATVPSTISPAKNIMNGGTRKMIFALRLARILVAQPSTFPDEMRELAINRLITDAI